MKNEGKGDQNRKLKKLQGKKKSVSEKEGDE